MDYDGCRLSAAHYGPGSVYLLAKKRARASLDCFDYRVGGSQNWGAGERIVAYEGLKEFGAEYHVDLGLPACQKPLSSEVHFENLQNQV